MPTLGTDCQIILDGTGYWIDPASFHCARPRVRSSTYNRTAANPATHAGAGERYVDSGPGKREWTFTVLAWTAIDTYAGVRVAANGQAQRDALHASYEKVAVTIPFVDPQGASWTVHFDHLEEDIHDVRAQATSTGSLQYLCHVMLVEA